MKDWILTTLAPYVGMVRRTITKDQEKEHHEKRRSEPIEMRVDDVRLHKNPRTLKERKKSIYSSISI